MNGNLGVGRKRHIFITTFMNRIQFCILTGNEKDNSSQIYQTCAHIISSKSCVPVIPMQERSPKEKGNQM